MVLGSCHVHSYAGCDRTLDSLEAFIQTDSTVSGTPWLDDGEREEWECQCVEASGAFQSGQFGRRLILEYETCR